MINDDVLERLLGEAGSAYDVPDQGRANVLHAAGPLPSPRRPWWVRHRVEVVAGAVSLALVGSVGGLALTDRGGGTAESSSGGIASRAVAPQSAPAAPDRVGASKPGAATAPAGPAVTDGARVVKTGSVDLTVSAGQVSPTLARLQALGDAEGGYVASSQTDEGGGRPSGTVTLRVPVAAFTPTVTRIRALGHVDAVTTSGRDVTAQYTDLDARLRALSVTRASFLDLLSKASTIGDTLAVQQQITDVQQQIEQLQGQQKVLADQSDMATLDVAVTGPGGAVGHKQSGLRRAVGTAVHGFVDGVEALIAVSGPVLLALLVLGVVAVVLRLAYRLVRRRLV